ncbi:MAG: hypothetical protein ACOYMA_14405 [Bacteroidia bacterium]
MKKFSLFLIVISILFSLVLSSQNKPAIKKKAIKSSKNEIDILAEKYKGKETTTAYTTYGEMVGKVTIIYNLVNLPQAVSIEFQTENDEISKAFTADVYNSKIDQGYKKGVMLISKEHVYASGLFNEKTYHISGESYDFEGTLMKGNMYFDLIVKRGNYKSGDLDNGKGQVGKFIFIKIESGDESRKGGKKSEKFNF